MKIIVLIENKECKGLEHEHGLSLYIEFEGKKYLLDAGSSAKFKDNAVRMGVDLTKVDRCFLSHGHFDHAGGLLEFIQMNEKANIVAQEEVLAEYRIMGDGMDNYVGIPQGLKEEGKKRFQFVKGCVEVEKNVYVLSHSTSNLSIIAQRAHLFVKKGDQYVLDDFAHEQSLIFDTPSGLVVMNSCSHAGAKVILQEVRNQFGNKRIKAFLGGLHLMGFEGMHSTILSHDELRGLAMTLAAEDIDTIYTGHCTGYAAYDNLKELLHEKLHYLSSGTVIHL